MILQAKRTGEDVTVHVTSSCFTARQGFFQSLNIEHLSRRLFGPCDRAGAGEAGTIAGTIRRPAIGLPSFRRSTVFTLKAH
jgi:hypothetical protein